MSKAPSDNQYFGTEKTMKILFKLAPPVMLAQLIQSLYNIVDSYFVARISENAMEALSLVFPIQNFITDGTFCNIPYATFHMCRCSRNRCRRQYRYGTVLRSKANFQSD